jgi:sugar lactone lactonase YvrE
MPWQGKGALGVAAIAAAVALCAGTGARAATDAPCRPWNVRTVASGLGVLENLEPDGRGDMLLSQNDQNAIGRLTPDGKVTTLITGVPSPGGQRIRGRYLYFNTGDSAQAGIAMTTDGTIQRYDMQTGARITWASGLSMPNGLLFLPTGDPVVSRDSPGWGITRIPFADPAHPQRNWVQTSDSNGLAVDPTGTWLYFDQTFQPGNAVFRARIANPSDVEQVASLGTGLVLDDMTIDRGGVLYIASNRPQPAGELVRFDPYTGAQCTIASGLADPSSVKFGCGPGWPSDHLFVTSFQGEVYDVSAPSGVPAPRGNCDVAR